jgi:PKD repeat protein
MPTRFVGSLLRSLLLSVLGCLSAAPAIAQTNLLTNPGFETGQAAPWDNGGGAQLTAAAAHSGNYGVRMTTSQFLTQGWIAVTPGQTYVVTGWFKWNAFAGTDWGYDFLDVLGNDFQAETVASQLHTRYPQNTWVKLALTFVARTTAVQVRFGVYGPQTTIDLAFDDLLIARKLTNTGPTVAPTATPTSGVAPLAVQFAANANDTDGAVGVVQWDFGDGSTSPLDGTSHTYTTRGTYQARITAWDDNGASATQTVSIQVTADGNPTITIAQPTTQDTLATAAATATLSGTALAPAGRTIQSVVWDNVTSRTAGIVAVTPAASINWNAGAVGLKPGKNDILVTTVDSTGAASTDRIVVTRTVTGPVVSNVTLSAANARQFEKVELNFDLATVADFPMYRYDTAPPPGVVPGTGVTVEGVFVTPSGQTLRQPGFIYGAVTTSTVAGNLRYEETGPVSWKVRFSPLETGTYSVTLHVQDASGTTDVAAGQFTAAAASRRGFVRVSDSDSRYFEFTNRDLFFPIGPANGPAYSSYTTPGLNFERPWMAGEGAYSGNWSRWLRIDMAHGNEGTDPPLSLVEHFPSHELSYELYAGAGPPDLDGRLG